MQNSKGINTTPHIKCRVTFYKIDKPAQFHSGNWMHFRLGDNGINWGGIISLVGKDVIEFGETTEATVRFVAWDQVKDLIKEDLTYKISWPMKVHGEIEVTEILDYNGIK